MTGLSSCWKVLHVRVLFQFEGDRIDGLVSVVLLNVDSGGAARTSSPAGVPAMVSHGAVYSLFVGFWGAQREQQGLGRAMSSR